MFCPNANCEDHMIMDGTLWRSLGCWDSRRPFLKLSALLLSPQGRLGFLYSKGNIVLQTSNKANICQRSCWRESIHAAIMSWAQPAGVDGGCNKKVQWHETEQRAARYSWSASTHRTELVYQHSTASLHMFTYVQDPHGPVAVPRPDWSVSAKESTEIHLVLALKLQLTVLGNSNLLNEFEINLVQIFIKPTGWTFSIMPSSSSTCNCSAVIVDNTLALCTRRGAKYGI